MSDSKFVDPFSFESKNSEVEIMFGGKSTGLIVDVRPNFAAEVKKVQRAHQRALTESMRKNGGKLKLDFEASERQSKERAIAHVADWRWKKGAVGIGGQLPKFSIESLSEMLEHKIFGPVLQEQILGETDDLENFLAESASNSTPS